LSIGCADPPLESGYYRARLRREGGVWLITLLEILHDLPMALPEEANA
jgi:hypothetical protein